MARRETHIILDSKTYKEHGIVLNSLKYGERQLIVHMLTETRGRCSYITRIGGGSSRGQIGYSARSLFQPLFLIEFQASNGNGTMGKLQQAAASRQLSEIPFDVVKSSLTLFISELLYRLVRYESTDSRLFHFVRESVTALDLLQEGVANFHIHFMMRLTHHMGFAPRNNHSPGAWLDIKTGEYTRTIPAHTLKIEPGAAELLNRFDNSEVRQLGDIKLGRKDRVQLLNHLVDYYGYHQESIDNVQSIRILGELF